MITMILWGVYGFLIGSFLMLLRSRQLFFMRWTEPTPWWVTGITWIFAGSGGRVVFHTFRVSKNYYFGWCWNPPPRNIVYELQDPTTAILRYKRWYWDLQLENRPPPPETVNWAKEGF